MCFTFFYRCTRTYLYVSYFVNFSRTLSHSATTVTIYVCVYVENVYGFTTFLRNVNSARICLRLYRSYVRPRLKFNAIKPREMSAVEGISVAPFQTPTLHSYGVYSAETFTVLQLSLRCDVRRQCNGLRVRDIHGGA